MATTDADAFEQAFADLGFDDEDTPEEGPEPVEEETPDEAAEEAPEEVEDEPASSDDEDEDEDPDEEDADEPSDDDPEQDEYEVKVQGETLKVSLEELKNGYQRQQDYTKKAQEVADQRRELEQHQEQFQEHVEFREQVEAWYAERSSNPADWVQEIAAESPDPTATIARALKTLAESGALDPEFVETFGLTAGEVAKRASDGESEDRLARIEREIQERRQAEDTKRQQDEVVAEYRRQWADLKTEAGLSFDSIEEERKAGLEVLQFAHDRQITDLKAAYGALQWERSRSQPPEPAPAKPAADPQVAQRKRSARAISPRSASSTPAPAKAKGDREAVLMALEQFAGE